MSRPRRSDHRPAAVYVARRDDGRIRRETLRRPCAPGTSGLTTMGQPYAGGRKREAGMPGVASARGACRGSRGRAGECRPNHVSRSGRGRAGGGRSRGRRRRGDPTWSSPEGRGRGAGAWMRAVRARARANVMRGSAIGAAVARACECKPTTYPVLVGGAVVARVRECKNRDADRCARAGPRAGGGHSDAGCPRPSTRQRNERIGDRRGGCASLRVQAT